jgi:hypothetical protein
MPPETTYTIALRHKDVYTIKNNKLQNIPDVTLNDLVDLLTTRKHKITRYSKKQFKELSKEEQKACKEHIPYFVGAHFYEDENTKECERKAVNFKERNLLTYDIDYADENTISELITKLEDKKINYIIYNTISHYPEENIYRYRLIILLEHLIYSRKDYANIFIYFCNLLDLSYTVPSTIFDRTTSIDVTRALFLPTELSDQTLEIFYNVNLNNLEIDKEKLLLQEQQFPPDLTLSQAFEPGDMSGLQGTFNSVYTAIEILYLYGQDAYAPEDPEDPLNPAKRWHYRLGTSTSGIRFYSNGQWLHSEHNSDPLNVQTENFTAKQWDAFSLYAFLKFNNDQKAAMDSLANDPKVMAKVAEEFKDFDHYAQEASKKTHLDYIQEDEIHQIIKSKNPKEVFKFLAERCCLLIDKGSLVFLLPIEYNKIISIQVPGEDRSVYLIQSDKQLTQIATTKNGVESYFSYSGTFPDPKNPKRSITPAQYVINYCSTVRRYMQLTFLPFNKYSKKGLMQMGDKENSLRLNTFTGYAVEPNFNYENSQRSLKAIELFKHYISHILCADDNDLYVWVMDWIADIFQNPEYKSGTALVLYSKHQGTGKSTLFVLLKFLLGQYAEAIKASTITKDFNAQLRHSLLACIEDLDFQLRKSTGSLKSLITEQDMTYENKGKDSYSALNYSRLIITSNQLCSVTIESITGERRFTFIEVNDKFLNISDVDFLRLTEEDQDTMAEAAKEQSVKYFNELRYYCAIEAPAILARLLDHKITSNLRNKFKTDLYRQVAAQSHTQVDSLMISLKKMSYKELLDLFNRDFEEEHINKNSKSVNIKKSALCDHFNEEYRGSKKISKHLFVKMLRESEVIKKYNIRFSDPQNNVNCNRVFSDKWHQAIVFPLTFFDNLYRTDQEQDEYYA